MILNRHECAVHSLAGNRKRAGCGNKQCIPTFAMKTTIGGSFGNYYFPTPFEVTACSTRSLPLSGTIASVFSFIRLSLLAFSSGPQNTKIVLLADLSLAKTFFFSLSLTMLSWIFLFFFLPVLYVVLGNLGQNLGIGIEMMASMAVIINKR